MVRSTSQICGRQTKSIFKELEDQVVHGPNVHASVLRACSLNPSVSNNTVNVSRRFLDRKPKLKEKLAQIEGDEVCQMEVLKTRIRRFKKDLNKIKIDEIDSKFGDEQISIRNACTQSSFENRKFPTFYGDFQNYYDFKKRWEIKGRPENLVIPFDLHMLSRV